MMSTWCRSEYLTATCLLKELTMQNYSYIQEHISIYFKNLDRFQHKLNNGGHLSGHFEFLKILNDASTTTFRLFNT